MAQKLAVVVGGGPAPGINGVISAVTFEAVQQGLDVIGVYDGFKWLSKGDTSHILRLNNGEISRIHLRGGSIIGTSRDNPTKSPEKMANVVKALADLCVKYLVTIGGDDTAFTATRLEQQAGGKIAVCYVPKTIDNDLPLPHSVPTLGFETARQLGSQLVENIMEDTRTADRWYFVITIGRSAGHLALGMGMGAGATLTFILDQVGFETAGNSGMPAEVEDAAIVQKTGVDSLDSMVGMPPGTMKFESEHSTHDICALLIPPPLHESIFEAETQKYGFVIRSWDTAGRYGHA